MIIETEAQCRNTKEWIGRFSEALAYLEANPPTDLEPWFLTLLKASYADQVKTLQRQVTAYETGIPEQPRELTPEQLERVAQIRKEFEDRFGRRPREDAAREIP